jgi:hypothetical protein
VYKAGMGDLASTLHTISTWANGFFDFVVTVALVGLALTAVRKADATLGYVLAGAMGLRFATVCCSRIAYQTLGATASADSPIPLVLGGVSILGAFVELAVWGAVGFVLFRLAKKIAGT